MGTNLWETIDAKPVNARKSPYETLKVDTAVGNTGGQVAKNLSKNTTPIDDLAYLPAGSNIS